MAHRDAETSKAQRVSDSIRGIWEIVNKPPDPPVRRRNSSALITGGVAACLLFAVAIVASGVSRDKGVNAALATIDSPDRKTQSPAAQTASLALRAVSPNQPHGSQSSRPIPNAKVPGATVTAPQLHARVVRTDVVSLAEIEPSEAPTQFFGSGQVVGDSNALAALESLESRLSSNASIPPLNTVGGPIATRFARLNAETEVATEPASWQSTSTKMVETLTAPESNQSQLVNTMAIPAAAPANAAGNPLPASIPQADPRRADSRVPLLPLPDFEPILPSGGTLDAP